MVIKIVLPANCAFKAMFQSFSVLLSSMDADDLHGISLGLQGTTSKCSLIVTLRWPFDLRSSIFVPLRSSTFHRRPSKLDLPQPSTSIFVFFPCSTFDVPSSSIILTDSIWRQLGCIYSGCSSRKSGVLFFLNCSPFEPFSRGYLRCSQWSA